MNSNLLPKWQKHPSRRGVLVRTLTAEQARREKEDEEEERLTRESRRWVRPIPPLSREKIERLAKRTWCGLGGKICDIIRDDHLIVLRGDHRWAIRRVTVVVQYENEEGVLSASDPIGLTIYRDALNPSKLRLEYGRLSAFNPTGEPV